MDRNRNRPVEVNELLNQINKMDLGTRLTRDELNGVLMYYQKL